MSLVQYFSLEECTVLLGKRVKIKNAIMKRIEEKDYVMDKPGVTGNIIHIVKNPEDGLLKLGVLIDDNDLQEFDKKDFWHHFQVMYS